MQIQIIDTSVSISNDSTYHYTQMNSGNLRVNVLVAKGRFNSVEVFVMNASHMAFKGPGKSFKDAKMAEAHYKNPKIRAMITYAVEEANQFP